jgi:amidase
MVMVLMCLNLRLVTILALVSVGFAAVAGEPDWRQHDIASVHRAMEAGETSAETLTRFYLERIENLDASLSAVLAIDPTALDQARALDEARKQGQGLGPLHGIPILLKDNIETATQATTAGSLALKDNHTGRDAPLVDKLRAAGAVIVGKANLSEWANFRSSRSSSGWSAVGGQTRNPFDLSRTPCGSSSGSAAAVAAGFAIAAIGTETNGSIVCPASANGNTAIKPTVGLVSRTHIVPISHNMDTAGPMARNLADAVHVLAAMVDPDERDPATLNGPGWNAQTLLDALKDPSLQGRRIGVIGPASGFHPEVADLLDQALENLKASGAEIVPDLAFDWPEGFFGDVYSVLLYDFKHGINRYLADLPDADLAGLTLADLIEFNHQHADQQMPFFGQEHFELAEAKGDLNEESYTTALARILTATREQGIDRLLAEHQLDALVAPTGGPAWKIDWVNGDHFGGGSSTPAAVAGYPNITLPMGQIHGLPVGLSFFAGRYTEPLLIEIAAGFEHISQPLSAPKMPTTLAP